MFENAPDYFRVLCAAIEFYALHGDYKEEDRELIISIAQVFIQNEETMLRVAKNMGMGLHNDLIDDIQNDL